MTTPMHSYMFSCTNVRHVNRTHKLDLGIVKERIEDGDILEHVETKKQAADIFT